MTEIKNLLFQPLTFHLADGRGLHLGPRERRPIADEQISPEIALAEKRRLVQIDRVASAASERAAYASRTATSRASSTSTSSPPAESASGTDESPATGRRKRR